MKKTFGPLFVFMLTVTTYQQDIQKIDQAFFQAPEKKEKPIELPVQKKRKRGQVQLGDLEQKYFEDTISTRAAAPVRSSSNEPKKRSR